MAERLLTTGEAGRRLGRSAECVRLYAKAGRLPAQQTERGLRVFSARDVEKLAKELRVQEARRGW